MDRNETPPTDELVVVVSEDERNAELIAGPLRDRGWFVDTQSGDAAAACRAICKQRPSAVVISLDAEGEPGECDLPCALSVAQVAHDVPVVFVGGSAETVALARQIAPGALFVEPPELPLVVKRLVFRQ